MDFPARASLSFSDAGRLLIRLSLLVIMLSTPTSILAQTANQGVNQEVSQEISQEVPQEVTQEVRPGAVQANEEEEQWQEFEDAQSPVTFLYPKDWQAKLDKSNGRIDIKAPDGAMLSWLLFSVSEDAAGKLAPEQFVSVFLKTVSQQSWSSPQLVSNQVYRADYKKESESGTALLFFSPAQASQGALAGRLCLFVAPAAALDHKETFAEILSSFSLASPQSASSLPADSEQSKTAGNSAEFNWTRYTDPAEGSFSLDVPSGWTVQGRLDRFSALDVRPWVKAVSPDQMVTAFIGDGKLAPCTMPNATLSSLGFHSGRNYNGSLVLDYIPARRFAEKYARSNLSNFISDLTVVDAQEHPEIAAAVNGTVGATRSEAATIKLTGMYGNIPAVAYYLAVTKATVAHGTGMWWVTKVAGVVAPADRDGEALGVILHMLQSFEVDQAWAANSLRNTVNVSNHYRQVSQQISKSISDRYWSQQAHNDRMNQAYWNRQASQDRSHDGFSNYIRGVENVYDPNSGNAYKVQYGPQEHYIDSSGSYILGTDNGAAPDWTKLISIP